jgi:eukaryotic-like serine/threonine-protein kinase
VQDLSRGTLSRVTFEADDENTPEWTPDGSRLSYYAGANSPWIVWQRADGGGTPQRLVETQGMPGGMSWHPSGRMLAYGDRGSDIMILPLSGDESSGWTPGSPVPFTETPDRKFGPAFSPDGRWLAYSSNETGRYELYVRPFPGPGGKWQISTAGGYNATWSRSAPELLFHTPGPDRLGLRIMATSYSVAGASFRAETPRPWSPVQVAQRPNIRMWDLHPDGDRIVAAPQVEDGAPRHDKVVIVLDFADQLRRLTAP